jgi:hypothetical protein
VASVAVRQGQAERAARVLGAAAALRDRIEAPVAAHRRAALARIIAASQAELDEATFTTAWNVGQVGTLEQAISEAVGLAEALASPSS